MVLKKRYKQYIPKKLTEIQQRKIVEKYVSGMNIVELANEYGCHVNDIVSINEIAILIRQNKKANPKKANPRKQITKELKNQFDQIDKETKELICKEYLNDEPISFLSRRYNVSNATISRILRTDGIDSYLYKELQEEIYNEYLSGQTDYELSLKYKIQLNKIKRIIEVNNNKAKKAIKPVKIPKEPKQIPTEIEQEICKDYLDGIIIRKLVSKYEISHKVISSILKKNNTNMVRTQLSKDFINELYDKYKNGHTIENLSREYKMPVPQINRIITRIIDLDNKLEKKNRVLTPEQIKEIHQRYIDGDTMFKISGDYDCSLNIIRNVLKDIVAIVCCNNQKLDREKNKQLNKEKKREKYFETIKKKKKLKNLTPEQENEICQKYKNGYKVNELSVLFNCQYDVIRNILKKHNLKSKDRNKNRKLNKKTNQRFFQKIKDKSSQVNERIIKEKRDFSESIFLKYLSGITKKELVKEFKCSIATVNKILNLKGIKLIEQEICKDYTQGIRSIKIAKKYHCSVVFVLTILNKKDLIKKK